MSRACWARRNSRAERLQRVWRTLTRALTKNEPHRRRDSASRREGYCRQAVRAAGAPVVLYVAFDRFRRAIMRSLRGSRTDAEVFSKRALHRPSSTNLASEQAVIDGEDA